MMSIWDFLFPVERSIATAAFIGTIVLLLNGKKRGKSAIVTVVVANYLAAVYLTNLIAEMTNLKSHEGIAFAIGFGGFALVDKIISEIPKQLNNHLSNGNSNPPAE